ncbi:hypothetical protein V2J09_017098 [Rumex salicifolius]
MMRKIKEQTEIKAAIDELSFLQNPGAPNPNGAGAPAPSSFREAGDHNIPVRPLLVLSNIILQILDKIGPTMAVLRQDMSQNIQRLEMRIDSDPTKYSNVIEILKKEADEGSAKDPNNPSQSMEEMVEESYELTLKPWHGWISSAAYKIALKLLPDNKTFIELLSYKGQTFSSLHEEIQTLVTLLVPLLDDIHFVLKMHGLDRLKCT